MRSRVRYSYNYYHSRGYAMLRMRLSGCTYRTIAIMEGLSGPRRASVTVRRYADFALRRADLLALPLLRDHTFAVAAIRNGTSGRGVK
jgi:hypothetical protein